MSSEISLDKIRFNIKQIDNDHYEVFFNNQSYIVRKIYDFLTHEKISYNYFIFEWNQNYYNCYITEDKNYIYLTLDGKNTRVRKKETDYLSVELEVNVSIIYAPMAGKVIKIFKNIEQKVSRGETIMILESMKMENHITALKNGIIKKIFVKENHVVETHQPLVEMD